MRTQPLFSILIAQFNNGEFFQQCYDSIIQQTYLNWEVIIVDDSSNDDSVQIMNNIVGEDTRFKIIQNDKNYGCGYTKRKCVEYAQGNICGFLDPDDALTSDALYVLVDAHAKNEEASAIYSNHYICDRDLNVQSLCHWTKQQPKEIPCYQKTYVGHFLTFKRALYIQSPGINPYLKRAVDVDLHCHLQAHGDMIFLDKPMYYYRLHHNGISTFDNRDKALVWVDIVKVLHGLKNDENFEKNYVENKVLEKRQWKDDLSQTSLRKMMKEILIRIKRKIIS